MLLDPAKNQLCNHLFDLLQIFQYYQLLLTGWSKTFCPLIIALWYLFLHSEDDIVYNLFAGLYFQIVKQRVYLFFQNMDQLSTLNIAFVFPLIFLIDVLFQLIVILKPDFNCSSSFVLSWVKSYNWNIKFCISYWKCCGLSCYISNHYNAVCRPI